MKWSAYILDEFPEEAFERISLLVDPESLVADEHIFAELEQRGYLLFDFNDKLELRYFYEQNIRHTDAKLIIVIRNEKLTIDDIPYDIGKASRLVSVSLSDLFPTLNFTILNELNRKEIPHLFEIRDSIPLTPLGEDKTCEFLLEHLFDLSLEAVNKEKDLLIRLFWIHFDIKLESPHIQKFIARKLSTKSQFSEWDIDRLVTSADNFLTFLQERWECFVNNVSIVEKPLIRGPAGLPFDFPVIKTYMLSLFSSGKLHTTSVDGLKKTAEYLSGKTQTPDNVLLKQLHTELENRLPLENTSYPLWLDYAEKWAELTSMYISAESGQRDFIDLQRKINLQFQNWLSQHYNSLLSLPPQKPILLHQLIRFMARQLEEKKAHKYALIVIDGLAFNQWSAIRPDLERLFAISVTGCFAWIPTQTSISRQSIFAGKQPSLFQTTIDTTAKEESLWGQAWEEYGLKKSVVMYAKSLGSGDPTDILEQIGPQKRVCGLVIDTVDKIMHGMQQGNAGMHNQIRQWLEKGYLQSLITGLLDLGFSVLLTSDHGNIECCGSGRLQDGILAEITGERVRTYQTKALADDAITKYPISFLTPSAGLPQDMFPITLPCQSAFHTKGQHIIAHGGCSIEEVIVPFVQINEKKSER